MFPFARRTRESMTMVHHDAKPADRFMLWIDGVGGYWVCLADELIVGQPGSRGGADIPILADISARHARIRRDGEGYLIDAFREVRVGGRLVDATELLGDGSRIEIGPSVKLQMRCASLEPHRPTGLPQPASHAAGGRRGVAAGRFMRAGPQAAEPYRLPRMEPRGHPFPPRRKVLLPRRRPIGNRWRGMQAPWPVANEFPR